MTFRIKADPGENPANIDAKLRFADANEPDWSWTRGEVMENLATQLGCDINRLPRLVGTGEGRSEEGKPLEISCQLVAPFEGWLVGRYQWRGGGVTMTRSVDFKEWFPGYH